MNLGVNDKVIKAICKLKGAGYKPAPALAILALGFFVEIFLLVKFLVVVVDVVDPVFHGGGVVPRTIEAAFPDNHFGGGVEIAVVDQVAETVADGTDGFFGTGKTSVAAGCFHPGVAAITPIVVASVAG